MGGFIIAWFWIYYNFKDGLQKMLYPNKNVLTVWATSRKKHLGTCKMHTLHRSSKCTDHPVHRLQNALIILAQIVKCTDHPVHRL